MSSESLQSFLQYARTFPNLTATEERALLERAKAGDRAARDRLVHSNIRLCFKLARDWAGCGLPQEDLVQEALVGLNIAVSKLDPSKGRLTTYATRWINKMLWDAAYGTADTIKRPSRLSRTATAVRDYLVECPGADVDEIAVAIRRPESEVREAMDHGRVVASTSEEDFREVGRDEVEAAESVLADLDPDEREALSWRHGLYGTPRSAVETARLMSRDLSVEGEFTEKDVNRLCRSATRKLRDARQSDDDVICIVNE